jgi:phosphatidylserine/phosphatidylglycerophosphate/cardiolipin synthase-like enzyme
MFATLISFALLGSPAQAALDMNSMPAPGAYVNAEGGPLLPLLQNAKSSIDIEIYTMKDLKVRELLRAALARGVKVRIVKDGNPLGERCDVFGASDVSSDTINATPSNGSTADCADQQKLVRDVRAAGGEYVPFNKSALCPNGGGTNGNGCFEHGKIAIVDGSLALLSTGNFDSTNLCIASENPRSCDRDYSLVIGDATVLDTMQRIFNADLGGARYDVSSMIPSTIADSFTVSPVSLKPIVAFIDSARSSLAIETQYLKDPDMNDAIVRAAKRGVKVQVTVASFCAFGKPSQSEVNEVNQVYGAFDAAGVDSITFTSKSLVNGHAGYVHAKAIIVDGVRAWVGSVNGSAESLTQNREYGLIFDAAKDVSTVATQMSSDHRDGGDESWQDSLNCVKEGRGGSVNPAPTVPSDPAAPTPPKKTPAKPRAPKPPRGPKN